MLAGEAHTSSDCAHVSRARAVDTAASDDVNATPTATTDAVSRPTAFLKVLETLNYPVIQTHLDNVGPYKIFERLSDDEWEYVVENDEKVGFPLRMLWRSDDGIFIFELQSRLHDSAVTCFHDEIRLQDRNRYLIDRATAADLIGGKRADISFAPNRGRGIRAALPAGVVDYRIFIVEVGISQGWNGVEGLDAKGAYWLGIAAQLGLQYLLLVHIDGTKTTFEYKFYDINAMPPYPIPAAVDFSNGNHSIPLENTRLFGWLPVGYRGTTISIDLSNVRDMLLADPDAVM